MTDPRALTPPPTDRPSRRRNRAVPIALGVVAAAAVVGTGIVVLAGGDGGSSVGPREGVTAEDLEPALITQSDVGDDFVVDDFDAGAGDDGPPAADYAGSEACGTAMGALGSLTEPASGIGARFENTAEGFIEESISLGGDGQPDVSEVRWAIERCVEPIGITEDGVTGEIRVAASDVGAVGDAAAGIVAEVSFDGAAGRAVELELYGVLWERDGVRASVSGFGGVDQTTAQAVPIDRDRIDDLARVSDARLVDLLSS